HDRLQWQLDREIEVGREKRTTAVEGGLAVGFKCIGCVVERYLEQNADEEIREPIDNQFEPWVADNAATFYETAAKHTVPAVVQLQLNLKVFYCACDAISFVNSGNHDTQQAQRPSLDLRAVQLHWPFT